MAITGLPNFSIFSGSVGVNAGGSGVVTHSGITADSNVYVTSFGGVGLQEPAYVASVSNGTFTLGNTNPLCTLVSYMFTSTVLNSNLPVYSGTVTLTNSGGAQGTITDSRITTGTKCILIPKTASPLYPVNIAGINNGSIDVISNDVLLTLAYYVFQ